jgi:hypothetical protein
LLNLNFTYIIDGFIYPGSRNEVLTCPVYLLSLTLKLV